MNTNYYYKPTDENYIGIGKIFLGEQFIARVQCELRGWQQYSVKSIDGNIVEELGKKEMRGTVTVSEYENSFEDLSSPFRLIFENSTYNSIEIRLEKKKRSTDNECVYVLVQTEGNGFGG